jgi:hypothetical protein
MSGNSLKSRTKLLAIGPGGWHSFLQKLILGGFFDDPVSTEDVVRKIREKFGKRLKTTYVQTYMQKFMKAEIIHSVRPTGHRGNYWVLTSVPRDKALRLIGKSERVRESEQDLFSKNLVSHLSKNFGQELSELESNFGRNGNCTAFLLRKILEKLIIVVFAKNGKGQLLEDKNRPGGWVGLKDMIEISAREKIHGVSFLTSKTANEIKGIKFLGDTAAHNPLVGVDLATILPQMPYIITAYEELAKRL